MLYIPSSCPAANDSIAKSSSGSLTQESNGWYRGLVNVSVAGPLYC